MSLLIIVLLFLFIALGAPITFALGLAALVFFITNGIPLETFAQRIAVGADSFALLAAPFFILAGNVMNTGGITRRIFRFANAIIGHIPGGLGHVNVLGSTIFAGMSGTAIADAAGLGAIEIEAMKEQGYDIEFSTAVTAASSIIGPIIPPSAVMLVYGIAAGVSVSKLFMGGLLPGILIAILLMIMVAYYTKKNKYPRGNAFSFKELWRSFKESIWALLTPVIIVGGILSGVFTATEAGAIASAYAIIVSVLIYKEMKPKDLIKVLYNTAISSGVVLLIVSTASAFGWCLVYDRMPQNTAQWLINVINSKFLLLVALTLIYLFLGTIMSATSIILTTVPIFVPVVKLMGIDLVYFGVYISILMSIGTVTPPVGTVLFILSKITNMSIEKMTRVLKPWYGILIFALLLLLLFPQIVTFLPEILF
ncbi:MAG TPA: TRAP transporter large permease [Clostridiaceae bacterium]|nr:TRAP transporter large permease [Clostridiaceae bacterium]